MRGVCRSRATRAIIDAIFAFFSSYFLFFVMQTTNLAAAKEIVSVLSILCIYFLNIFGNTFPLNMHSMPKRTQPHTHVAFIASGLLFCHMPFGCRQFAGIRLLLLLFLSNFHVKFAHFVAFMIEQFRPVVCCNRSSGKI